MKNIYIKPVIHVMALTNDVVLLGDSTEPYETGSMDAKRNDFSSFDYDFDEEEDTESNFKSKSLWD